MVIATAASATTTIVLEGIQWTTFRSLMAESETDYGYKIIYAPNLLQIQYIKADSTLAEGTVLFDGISWQTYSALMTDVGDG